MRDTAFKRVVARMPLGTEVRLGGPFGNLTLHTDATRPAAFLAGGIGITPFRSILVHAAKARLPHRVFLFYSNRRPEDAAFLDELQALQRENPNYTFIGTMTAMERSERPWLGETGHVDQAMLARVLSGVARPIFYIAGPPQMVSGLHAVVNGGGVSDSDIRTENFTGY
jgi:ferredoxin-NADP reductase